MASAWKHQTFAREYFKHGNATRALKATGSKANPRTAPNLATKLLHDPRTQAELEKLRNQAEANVVHSVAETKAEVNATIDKALRLAENGTVVVGKNGVPVITRDGIVVRKPDIGGMLKAAELKGKTVAMFRDVQQIEGEMDGKSIEELEIFFLSALLTNPMLLERICKEDTVARKVHELERRAASSGEGDAAASEEEAEPVSSASEAGSVPQGRFH